MKTIKIILSFIIISLFTISCDDWLDVKPKTQVESSELLKDEAGYKDALWGVYTCLLYTSPSPRDRSLSRMPSSA